MRKQTFLYRYNEILPHYKDIKKLSFLKKKRSYLILVILRFCFPNKTIYYLVIRRKRTSKCWLQKEGQWFGGGLVGLEKDAPKSWDTYKYSTSLQLQVLTPTFLCRTGDLSVGNKTVLCGSLFWRSGGWVGWRVLADSGWGWRAEWEWMPGSAVTVQHTISLRHCPPSAGCLGGDPDVMLHCFPRTTKDRSTCLSLACGTENKGRVCFSYVYHFSFFLFLLFVIIKKQQEQR